MQAVIILAAIGGVGSSLFCYMFGGGLAQVDDDYTPTSEHKGRIIRDGLLGAFAGVAIGMGVNAISPAAPPAPTQAGMLTIESAPGQAGMITVKAYPQP